MDQAEVLRPQHMSQTFSSVVDPADTWAWRPGSAAAAVRQGAVALVLPRAEEAVQLRAVAKALRGEAVVVDLPLRAEAAEVE